MQPEKVCKIIEAAEEAFRLVKPIKGIKIVKVKI
jgi:hypothetical protein